MTQDNKEQIQTPLETEVEAESKIDRDEESVYVAITVTGDWFFPLKK